MPVVQGGGGQSIGGVSQQVGQVSQAATTQLNWRQMVGELLQWNPDLPATIAERFINNAYRKVIDYRNWYGLIVHGQVNVPKVYTAGTVALVNGNTGIAGTGSNWDGSMVGRQFRAGFTSPIYTIATVVDPTHLTLDLPWGGYSSSSSGYSIFQQLVSLGANVKRIITIVNQQQGFQLATDLPKAVIDVHDTWRTQTGWTRMCASWGPSVIGEPLYELYPIPTTQQAFPFLVYVQPPDLSDDNAFTYSFIRSDVVVMGAVPDALLFRGKESKYYDPHTAGMKMSQFAQELDRMSRADDNQLLQNLLWKYSSFPFAQMGGEWTQSHDDY